MQAAPIRSSANWRRMTVHEQDWDLKKWKKMDQLKRGKHIRQIEDEARKEDKNQLFLSAIRDGQLAEAEELLNGGIDVNCITPHTDSIGCLGTKSAGLHVAVLSGHLSAVTLLLKHGASVEARDRESCTPLILCAMYGHVFIASVLLDHGANPDVRGMHGQTPLHKAALHGHAAIASLLVERNADLKPKDHFGEVPLDLAMFSKSYAVANVLRRADGEDVSEIRHDASWKPKSKTDLAISHFRKGRSSEKRHSSKKKKKNRRSRSP